MQLHYIHNLDDVGTVSFGHPNCVPRTMSVNILICKTNKICRKIRQKLQKN